MRATSIVNRLRVRALNDPMLAAWVVIAILLGAWAGWVANLIASPHTVAAHPKAIVHRAAPVATPEALGVYPVPEGCNRPNMRFTNEKAIRWLCSDGSAREASW